MSTRTPIRATRRSTRSPQPTSTTKLRTAQAIVKSAPTGNSSSRPPLPLAHANDLLTTSKARMHSVKTQELKLNPDTTILIARVKTPTPKGVSGHLIKRFDTDAVSASSFFRVAFPTSSLEAEEAEMAFLRTVYDCVKAGGEDKGPENRLTGTWIPTAESQALAETYGIARFASELIGFENPFAPPNQDVPEPEQAVDAAPSIAAETRTAAKKATSPSPSEPSRTSKRARVTSPRLATRAGAPASNTGPPSSFTALAPQNESVPEAAKEADVVTVTPTTHDTCICAPAEIAAAVPLVGSDEQVAAAQREAKDLVANLKETVSGSASSDQPILKRDREVEAEADATPEAHTLLSRMWWRRRAAQKSASITSRSSQPTVASQRSERVQPQTRRNIALVGLAVAGAAASLAPYIFQ